MDPPGAEVHPHDVRGLLDQALLLQEPGGKLPQADSGAGDRHDGAAVGNDLQKLLVDHVHIPCGDPLPVEAAQPEAIDPFRGRLLPHRYRRSLSVR